MIVGPAAPESTVQLTMFILLSDLKLLAGKFTIGLISELMRYDALFAPSWFSIWILIAMALNSVGKVTTLKTPGADAGTVIKIGNDSIVVLAGCVITSKPCMVVGN
tara:strand:+ start:95 stop:412 length:318 start_codon:yes stop_codon:yes gene_type:complete